MNVITSLIKNMDDNIHKQRSCLKKQKLEKERDNIGNKNGQGFIEQMFSNYKKKNIYRKDAH